MEVPKIFSKGDIIRTNPKEGFYGLAIVLDDGRKVELQPNIISKPLCHIAITPYIFDYEFDIEVIRDLKLEPLIFTQYQIVNGERLFLRNKLCIDIYTNKNKSKLPVIGKIDPKLIYTEELLWKPQFDKFCLKGDPNSDLGHEAYINWQRNNSKE